MPTRLPPAPPKHDAANQNQTRWQIMQALRQLRIRLEQIEADLDG